MGDSIDDEDNVDPTTGIPYFSSATEFTGEGIIPHPELNKLREKLSEYIDNTVSYETIYDTIPINKIKGLKIQDAEQTVQVYQNLLRDLRLKPDTPIAKILYELEQFLQTPPYDKFAKYIAMRYIHLTIPQHAALIGWFCKVYGCHNRLPFTTFWPPPNYPTDAPPLYSITGYVPESTIDSDIRVLTLITERTRSSYSNLQAFIDALRNTDPSTGDIMARLNSLLQEGQKLTGHALNNLYQHQEVDPVTQKILVQAQGYERLLEGIMSTTPLQFLLKEANYSNYCESSAISFNYTPFELNSLKQELLDRNQMYFAFFPRCGSDSSPTNFNKSETLGIQLDNISWIEFNYDFPNSELCSAYNNIRDPDIGKEFQKIGVIQGYRTESFPHPDFVIAMSKGVNDAHPRVRAKWPEWFNDTGRSRWVQKTLAKWRYDISTMPVTTLYERNMKEVQELFLDYALSNISLAPNMAEEKQLTEKPGFMPKETVLHTLRKNLPTESPLPAMLSRVNKNANRNANAAFQHFNRDVRQFIKNPNAATVKARKRGFFTGESKNSYRRTLKGQLYQLMRASGAEFTPADAVTELPYIFELAHDTKVSDRVVYERMKDWVERYITANYANRGGAVTPNLKELDSIANLFIGATSSTRRADLQRIIAEAIRMARPEALPTRKQDMESSLRRVLFNPKQLTRGAKLYNELDRIRTTYRNVVNANPAVRDAMAKVVPPPKRGFFARTFGPRNTDYNAAIQSAAQGVLQSLEQEVKPQMPVALPQPAGAAKAGPPSNVPPLLPPTTGSPVTVSSTPTLYKVGPNSIGKITYWAVTIQPDGKILKQQIDPKNVTNVPAPVTSAPNAINRAVAASYQKDMQHIVPITQKNFDELIGVPPRTTLFSFMGRRKPGSGLTRYGPSIGGVKQGYQGLPGHFGGSRKTARHSKRMRSNRTRKQKQRGGAATSMPLAWYQQGAQFQGTVADPTGVGLAGSSAAWARSALPAQGGGRRRGKTRRQQQQQGGFSPSVMGAGFASVGLRLLPAAAYMGYNQYNNYRKQQRRTRRRK